MDSEEKNYIKQENSKNENSQNFEEENDDILNSKGFKKRDHYSKNDEPSTLMDQNIQNY